MRGLSNAAVAGRRSTDVFTVLKGDLLKSNAEALVNPVNTVGVSGAGLARAFAQTMAPDTFYGYQNHCRLGKARIGHVWAAIDVGGTGKIIVFFPTKRHWRERSDLGNVIEGLASLRALIVERHIKSIAVPALGCGLGGLAWRRVRPEIERALGDLDCRVMAYGPALRGGGGK